MIQKNKELLLKDLSCRIPYGVIVNVNGISNVKLISVSWYEEVGVDNGSTYLYPISEIKPYLFPLSSMTDELWDKEFRGYNITEFTRDSFKYGCETLEFYDHNPDLSDMVGFINQLIKHHFDIYGLISKGLAINATELNIY